MKHNGIQDPSTVAQNNFPTSQRVGFAAGTLPALPAITPPLRLAPPKLPESPQTQPRDTPVPPMRSAFNALGLPAKTRAVKAGACPSTKPPTKNIVPPSF
jgi:hypothetical protein